MQGPEAGHFFKMSKRKPVLTYPHAVWLSWRLARLCPAAEIHRTCRQRAPGTEKPNLRVIIST
jgi:hypothetical protein